MVGEILEREIHEQPQIIRRMIDQESVSIGAIADSLRGRFKHIMIAARGSSDNAARYGKYLFGAHNQIPVALAAPSLFTIYDSPPVLTDTLVIGISQSGASPDIVAVLAEARRQDCPTLAITSNLESPLAHACDHVIDLHTGVEQAVAATKTYTASLMALALLSSHLADDPHLLSALLNVPGWMGETLSYASDFLPRVERCRTVTHCVILSRGFNYSTAFEIALKIKELTRVVAEPYSSVDFLHGPISVVNAGFPILAIVPSGRVTSDLINVMKEVLSLGAEIIMISDEATTLSLATLPMRLPHNIPEWLTPCIAAIPGQMFSLELARVRGLDPDNPAGLSKITRTW